VPSASSHPWVRQRRPSAIIDSTAGPTAEELLAEQMALNAANGEEDAGRASDGYSKPVVISREVWCTHADCDYSAGLEYYPVSHLILHHTVSSNSDSDWAAVVRAIWSFHTYNRGWGDIGYNYLADMNGVLYEGHNGGDNVVGTHAADANKGSMALALIGTFTEPTHSLPGIRPPAPMLESAAELFAWKADQRDIDVYDASDVLPNVGWGLPHLMGHRDVYGTTECPGEQAHDLLPWLRDQVAVRIGLTSPYLYIDELSDTLTLSDANWYVPPYSCGHNGHAFYTWSTTDPAESVNWGEWRPQIPQDGLYEIQVYAPYCRTGRSETEGAHYTIHHANGVSDVVVSHEDNVGLWMSLGQYELREGFDTRIHLTDLTTTDDGRGIWFDAIRLRPFSDLPAVTIDTLQPTADAWATNTVIDFRWNVNYPSLVTDITLEVATDNAFTDIVLLKNLGGSEASFTYDVGQDYAHLYWRVKAKTVQDGIIVSAISNFSIDSTAPTSAVESIYQLKNGHYVLVWQGADASGIGSYNIDYRAQGQTAWTRLLADTTGTSAIFVPPDPGQTYWFRSQAKDALGNEEAAHAQGDTSTEQAILLSHAIMLPVISR
jgi:hypothetical protein